MMRGLLLDSGDTLMQPRGGRWNPRFDFEAVACRHLGDIDPDTLVRGIAAGDRFLRDWTAIEARAGYKAARADYHRTILAVLGVDDPTASLLDDLDRPLPYTAIVEPFADTTGGLARLHDDGWQIAIVADTSTGMVEVYRELGLDQMIETFVISGELGVRKPDPRMYRTASDRLRLDPADCVFVDDNRANLDGARALGYHVCGMARYAEPPLDGQRWVRDLDELFVHVAELRTRTNDCATRRDD